MPGSKATSAKVTKTKQARPFEAKCQSCGHYHFKGSKCPIAGCGCKT